MVQAISSSLVGFLEVVGCEALFDASEVLDLFLVFPNVFLGGWVLPDLV